MLIRLQKIIASYGICSRRKAEKFILNGSVNVNDKSIKKLGTKIDPDFDKIYINGKLLINKDKNIYIALNKPKGYISTCFQNNSKIVTDLIKSKYRLFPVGRLDKDSTGLLLMTNDGRIHHKLSHPSFKHEKEYYVRTKKNISSNDINLMQKGIVINKKKTNKAKVTKISDYKFKIILTEGRNRQIRRMIIKLNNKVITLKRIRIKHIKLGNIQEGKWRYLSNIEKKLLISSLKF